METVFDAGRRRATSQSAWANFDALTANYRQTMLTAFQEVEDNLAALRILEREAEQQRDATPSADEVRWNLILRALRLFYLSLGSFAAAALISLFGTILTASALHIGFPLIAFLGLLSGTVGVAGLILRCATMMRETRLAVRSLAEEAQAVA